MKRAILTIVGTVAGLVLLLSFKTQSAPSGGAAAGATLGTGSGTDGGAAAPAPSASSGPTAGSGTGDGSGTGSGQTSKSTTRTVTGDTIDTRWGPVQVQVTLKDGKITKVQALQLPSDNRRDLEINNFAVPQLHQETLSAQSAQIDTVSGATYTSEGYIRSLQSALDKAGK
ncbi:FMN-binding protein [Actinoallomurus spadix]|uniref:FMN-binding domain-containing protein n=1 Tax=Actinoallomurus spadix TaxID=79912 RepID=A0ABN0VVM2_9ACTN|nr:FMN-binding protein [Actinoallomurus spadix]MCO5985794.1 FMN-binding protein [Actinoallomurus spadix]